MTTSTLDELRARAQAGREQADRVYLPMIADLLDLENEIFDRVVAEGREATADEARRFRDLGRRRMLLERRHDEARRAGYASLGELRSAQRRARAAAAGRKLGDCARCDGTGTYAQFGACFACGGSGWRGFGS